MKCRILHESRGRIRVHLDEKRMSFHQADLLEYYLKAQPFVKQARVYDATRDAVIEYTGERQEVIRLLAGFSYGMSGLEELVPVETGRALNREYEEKLIRTVAIRYLKKMYLPLKIRIAITILKSVKYIWKGLACLLRGKIEVPVLDATAILASMLTGDYGTASSVMFLLKIGEILEEWTQKKSVVDLAGAMAINVDRVWLSDGETERQVSAHEVKVGDVAVVRAGSMIPMDGIVCKGECTVNQASMTGESMPVRKTVGDPVYAGTVVEDGECLFSVTAESGSGRFDRIVKMIEDSEKLKSDTESRASHLADRLVPYSLGGTGLTYLLTRNVTRAVSILMVDFSCALKLTMPIAFLSAMKECSEHHIQVKGGKFMEAVSEATTIVFDKTGTLTNAEPRVREVVTFNGRTEEEMLRMAACLEEHFPHSIANAVVRAAKDRGLEHEEMHSKVEYIVAHGIASTVQDHKVIVGSHHFAFEDEKVAIPEDEQQKFDALPDEYSHLYLAIDGVLAAVILIEDALKDEAPAVLKELHELGISRIVMMTGDSERTARAVAARVGVDEYHAEVLPEDKAAFIRAEHAAGRKVIMVGDGINDSPALSEADAGIAIVSGAAIAREIADITISENDLASLVTLKRISDALMGRIHGNYRKIISFNLGLIILGVLGVLPPAVSALLHNSSTILFSLTSMTPLIGDGDDELN